MSGSFAGDELRLRGFLELKERVRARTKERERERERENSDCEMEIFVEGSDSY